MTTYLHERGPERGLNSIWFKAYRMIHQFLSSHQLFFFKCFLTFRGHFGSLLGHCDNFFT